MLPPAVQNQRVRLRTVVFKPRVGPEFAARALALSGPNAPDAEGTLTERFSTPHGSEERTCFPFEPSYVHLNADR